MTEETTMISGRVPTELKALVDADPRTNQEVMRAALWREFGGQRKGEIERRIEEKRRRMSMVESERNERQREYEQHQEEIAALEAKLQNVEEKKEMEQTELEQVIERLTNAPKDVTNPAIKRNAEELGITAQELLDKLPDDDDGSTGLNSL